MFSLTYALNSLPLEIVDPRNCTAELPFEIACNVKTFVNVSCFRFHKQGHMQGQVGVGYLRIVGKPIPALLNK